MAVLKEEVKMFITQSLACLDTPSQVVEAVKEEFGLDLARSHVQFFDPTKKQGGAELGKKYRAVFEETRKAFLEDITKIPIANKSFRLRALQRSYEFFTQRKNYIAANQVLEQAAKEDGGLYTNKMKVSGDAENPFLMMLQNFNGGSIPVVHDVEGEFTEVIEKPVAKAKEIKQVTKKVNWRTK